MVNSLGKFVAEQKAARNVTAQTTKVPGKGQVKNNAGGFVFKVSDEDRLERFLILGTDGGTYYVNENKHVKDNIEFLKKMIKRNERLVVDKAVDVSVNGRAYKNTPAIFALAAVLTFGKDKAYARDAVQQVCRTATHIFEFAQYVDDLGGWGRSKRAAVAEWYTSKDANSLAYQTVKYRQRNGWTHKDLLRLSHPKNVNHYVWNFVFGKDEPVFEPEQPEVSPEIIKAFREIQKAGSSNDVVRILGEHKNLPWETVPTEFLKDEKVWKTIFYNGQLNGQALLRNVTRMARIGAFRDMKFAADYADRLTDEEMIARTRIHPVNFLNALVVFSEGQVSRDRWGYQSIRNKDWVTNGRVKDALDAGFYAAFKHVEPAGKRTLIGLDVSGSMGTAAMGLELSCAQVGAAVAMTVARTEPYYQVMGFAADFRDLGITPGMSLSGVMRKTGGMTFGRTDCALPMTWALENKVEVETFVVITDSETYAGRIHPFQALKQYRDKMGIPARLAVLGVASTGFTIADPSDVGMMDFVGFDSAAPRVLADFSAGRL